MEPVSQLRISLGLQAILIRIQCCKRAHLHDPADWTGKLLTGFPLKKTFPWEAGAVGAKPLPKTVMDIVKSVCFLHCIIAEVFLGLHNPEL